MKVIKFIDSKNCVWTNKKIKRYMSLFSGFIFTVATVFTAYTMKGVAGNLYLSDIDMFNSDAKISEVYMSKADNDKSTDDVIKLRVCNWEEYIDLGDWDEEELIELSNGTQIIGENSLIDDFEEWYYETYGQRVEVEYSCFGTNEDLYNQLTMGDTYDLVCPSDYMIMKLMAEDKLQEFSKDFYNEEDDNNYYINGVSPYIKDVFETNEIRGESWSKYAAGYMWGITGIVYNPEFVTYEEASTWSVFSNKKFNRQITLKDNVRDTYFAMLGIVYADLLMDEAFRNDEKYAEKLTEVMNDVSTETISEVQDLLQDIMDNIYALETDSGKADMVTGKIVANYQWSGDAVYSIDQADEDGLCLKFVAPKECTNLWFDGWVMLKSGINGNIKRQHAAEAFVNFLSRPDNAVRNMYYIGYTSVIAGGEDDTIFEYADWCYGAEEDEEEAIYYPVGYFFTGNNEDDEYIICASADQIDRQLYAQYPSEEIINRAVVMEYFNDEESKEINQMWINIRCFNINNVPIGVWVVIVVVFAIVSGWRIRKKIVEK